MALSPPMKNLHVELENEYNLLKRMLYKSKNQHRRTFMYRKTKELFRKIKKRESMSIIKNVARDLYVLSSSNIPLGHFLGLTYVTMGISAKVFCIAQELEGDEHEEQKKESDSNEFVPLFNSKDFQIL